MKAKLNKMIADLQALVERAEELSDSENERTAERYQDIPCHLEAAIEALEEAVAELNAD